MLGYEPKIGDIVTLNATIIGITSSKNPIVKLDSGIKFLIRESDINSIRPKPEGSKEDMRKGS